ncbi:MAG: 2' O-ribose methyltransferase [Chrysothrix sp. TS-e1954]|nr:MAG: 2' O-ribose methyltransferase [Chrysothrix sp. TS-e1954]
MASRGTPELLINDKYKIFQKGATVVDLGFAPGSWSQVAANRTTPGGRVIGVDIIPAQPPRGVSTIQGDFLSPVIQAEVRSFVLDGKRGRPRLGKLLSEADESEDAIEEPEEPSPVPTPTEPGRMGLDAQSQTASPVGLRVAEVSEDTRVVDVVLSDMSEPWEQTTGFSKKSISDPYRRMMNTSGVNFRDHAGSMDLCNAALEFCIDTLQDGGHFVCKFYQGSEDKLLERKLRRMFRKVHRDKPDASRQESREAYFVALRRKEGLSKVDVLAE